MSTNIRIGIVLIATKLPKYRMPVGIPFFGLHFFHTDTVIAIQGRDCLVQKFRNSSVMLEHPSFRPKVIPTF